MSRDVRLFEIGHVFEWGHGGTGAHGHGRVVEAGGKTYVLPFEENRVAGVITGARRPPHWSEPQPPDADLFDIKGVLESVIAMAAPGATVEPADGGWSVRDGTRSIGTAREIAADRPAWAGRLFGFELLLRDDAAELTPRYVQLPAWPAVQRDVALIVGEGIPAALVEDTLRKNAGKQLERIRVFDEYRGKPLAEGERSVGWRLVFRATDRTLKDVEVDQALERAVSAAESAHGVRRREA